MSEETSEILASFGAWHATVRPSPPPCTNVVCNLVFPDGSSPDTCTATTMGYSQQFSPPGSAPMQCIPTPCLSIPGGSGGDAGGGGGVQTVVECNECELDFVAGQSGDGSGFGPNSPTNPCENLVSGDILLFPDQQYTFTACNKDNKVAKADWTIDAPNHLGFESPLQGKETYLFVATEADMNESPITLTANCKGKILTFKIIVTKVRIMEVTYTGAARTIYHDNGSLYPTTQQWQDNNDNGTAEDSGDHRIPMTFVESSELPVIASAKFSITSSDDFQGEITVKGVIKQVLDKDNSAEVTVGNTYEIEGTAVLSGDELEVSTLTCTTDDPQPGSPCYFVGHVARLKFIIEWEISVEEAEPFEAGKSENTVYLTLDNLDAATPLYETLLDIGCRRCDSTCIDAEATIEKIWADFESPIPGVKRKKKDGFNITDDVEMKFWNPPTPDPPNQFENMISSSNGNGTCFAWAGLFHNVLKTQGIAGSELKDITPIYESPFPVDPERSDLLGAVMLIKKWNFVGLGTAQSCQQLGFKYKVSEFLELSRIDAQGNRKSPRSFFNHRVVKYGNRYYDPSYGKATDSSLFDEAAKIAWENGAIDGYEIRCNDDKLLGRKNKEDEREINLP